MLSPWLGANSCYSFPSVVCYAQKEAPRPVRGGGRKSEVFAMFQPNDVDQVPQEEWEEFKKKAAKDELYYTGPGDLLDTPEGRAKFCRLNESGAFRKPDPGFPGFHIWVFNNQGEGMVVKKRSRVDPALMEDVEYNAEGVEISRSYEPA